MKPRVKNSIDRWRTFGSERFECWCVDWSNERAREYRAAGIRVRRVDGEMFLRREDWPAAQRIDEGRP